MKFGPLSFLFTCCILFSGLTASAQQLDSMVTVYAEQFPKERFHVHFDKPVYNKEETIWYKVYILDDLGLTQLSRNVYIEWFDQEGKLITQSTSPLFQSTAKGSFELPADYTGSQINMKVYTRWALNDDSAFLYKKTIPINQDPIQLKPVIKKPQTFFEVFPEGGNLVYGLNSKIAFKAVDETGKPVRVKALVVSNSTKTIDTLKIKHDGMGFFFLLPKSGETYSVKWTDPNGNTGITPIPVQLQKGVIMTLTKNNESAFVKVERTADVPENMKSMNLLVHMNQVILFKVALNAKDLTVLNAKIPIEELNTGILQFSLFSSDWLPLAERILFINNRYHEFGAKIIPQLTNLNKRAKNVFDVFVTDTAATNMSVAVIDASLDQPVSSFTIYSDLLLSSEIKGKIYNPGYYLSSDNDTVTANLDLVMLTHGWRRFDWEKLRANMGPTYPYPVETSLMKLGGMVYGLKTQSVNDVMLNLIVQNKDSSRNILFQPVPKDGLFEGNEFVIFDTAKIFYGFNQNQNLNDVTQVQFNNGLLKPSTKKLDSLQLEKNLLWNDSIAKARMNQFLQLQEEWKKKSQYKTLQEVIVRSRAKPKEDEIEKRYATGLFSGGDAMVFDLTNDPSAMGGLDIFTYLQGRVAGLIINRSGPTVTMSWRGAMPDLFIDQSMISPDFIQTMNIRDIAMVKVFRPPFFGSIGGGAGGAIAIYTKKGSDYKGDNSKSSKGMLNALLAGYTRFKEFYNPQYDSGTENPETDIRSTLYWNPYVITNKKSPRYRIQFFNNDISKKLLVVVEGVNAEGRITRVAQYLE